MQTKSLQDGRNDVFIWEAMRMTEVQNDTWPKGEQSNRNSREKRRGIAKTLSWNMHTTQVVMKLPLPIEGTQLNPLKLLETGVLIVMCFLFHLLIFGVEPSTMFEE